jgi:hypothetical protein
VPIELFQDVTAEVRTLVVPEGGELPPEKELEAMEAAEQAEAEADAAEAEQKEELDLEELDAAAAAQDAAISSSDEVQPTDDDVRAELADDEFDRAVDAGTEER